MIQGDHMGIADVGVRAVATDLLALARTKLASGNSLGTVDEMLTAAKSHFVAANDSLQQFTVKNFDLGALTRAHDEALEGAALVYLAAGKPTLVLDDAVRSLSGLRSAYQRAGEEGIGGMIAADAVERAKSAGVTLSLLAR